MKKIIFGMMALVAMVATSCQQDVDLDQQVNLGETATVSFNLATPQIATKADFSDGTTATHLQYAVYDANGTILPTFTVTDGVINRSTQVEFQLTTGNTYYVLFWAAAEGAPYNVDLAAKTMVVDYNNAVSSDENRDAFYYYDDFTVEAGMAPISAELKRPFAQLNIGTNDLAASATAGYTVTHAKVEVAAYSTLNLANGEVDGMAVRTFEYAAIPGSSQVFPVNDTEYDYLAMNYLLMGTTKETVDVKFTYATDATGANAKTRTVGSVPVQRNHRTNLYGQLITSNSEVNVTIKPEYDDMHNGVVEVATAEQFNAAFANPEVDFIVLAKDIVLTTSTSRANTALLTVNAGESLTINLNNHRLIAETSQLFEVAGELSIINGTIENKATDGKVLANDDDATLSNVTILQSTDPAYYDEQGDKLELIAEGVVKVSDDNYAITAACGLAWFATHVTECNGKTIELWDDIDLTGVKTNGDSFAPIGMCCSKQDVSNPFTGHFDGKGHTIKGIYQSGWDFGYEWGTTGYLGLFGYVKDATIENLTIEGMESVVEGGTLAAVAGRADGECTFKNITVKNSKLGTYNNRCGGIVGWTGGYYKDEAETEVACHFTFENIEICEDVVLGGLWGSFDSSIGGVMGQLNSAGSATFKNVTVSCRIDAYNDCTASYDYYLYRMCGMLIGQMTKTTQIDGSTYPDVAAYGITFDNVTVNYGKWMNYHYCEPTPGHNGGRGMRIEPGFTYDGLPADFDHTQCVDNHYNCIPFDQLFGGVQTACKGVKAWDGVTVNYPAEYTCPLCGKQHNVK